MTDAGPANPGRLQRLLHGWRGNWRIFVDSRVGPIGLALIGFFGLLAVLQPFLLGPVLDPQIYDPVYGFTDADSFPIPPSREHPLGVSRFGRDILSQLMYSVRVAFILGIVAAVISVGIGTAVGCLAAFYRGKFIDTYFMRQANFLIVLPTFTLLIVLTGVMEIDLFRLALIIGILGGFGGITVVLKARALTVVVKPFLDASRVAGGSDFHLLVRHVIPNVLPLSFLYMMFTVTGAIFGEAALSFFGLLPHVRMSLGLMINEAYTAGYLGGPMLARYWYLWVPPGLTITLLCAAFYLLGRGMDEVINPRLRRS